MKTFLVLLSVVAGVVAVADDLLVVAALGVLQNLSFTFVSRARNSGSVRYHAVMALGSNAIFAVLLVMSVAKVANPGTGLAAFVFVYTMSTTLGSLAAHVLALRYERGSARTVQEDTLAVLARRVEKLEGRC